MEELIKTLLQQGTAIFGSLEIGEYLGRGIELVAWLSVAWIFYAKVAAILLFIVSLLIFAALLFVS